MSSKEAITCVQPIYLLLKQGNLKKVSIKFDRLTYVLFQITRKKTLQNWRKRIKLSYKEVFK